MRNVLGESNEIPQYSNVKYVSKNRFELTGHIILIFKEDYVKPSLRKVGLFQCDACCFCMTIRPLIHLVLQGLQLQNKIRDHFSIRRIYVTPNGFFSF